MMKVKNLGRIDDGEKLAELLGYMELVDLENDIMWTAEEMLKEGKLSKFCDKQSDYISKEIYNMLPDLMMLVTYRKVLSYILVKELGVSQLIDTFGKPEVVLVNASGDVFIGADKVRKDIVYED
ncbi:MAG: hypothetical protein ACRC28_00925 [Clostridium sp.]|uniref:hypothetical protein n=1 Tax=Clostridia TaxID=186801 RepID=UPI003F3B76B3